MAVITYPIGLLYDDAGAILTAPVVTIAYVKNKVGADIASPGAVVNNSGTPFPISVDYDAEARGEAWMRLSVTQAGHTITGWNAGPVFYCAKDSGRVLTELDAAISSRATPADILANAAHKLATNAAGQVSLDLTQAIPVANTAQSVGDALNAARASGFGAWNIVGDTMTFYAPDGTTPVCVLHLNDITNPTVRT